MDVIEQALAQIVAWRRRGIVLEVAVNLSARNLLDSELPERVGALLAKHGVPAEQLVVEVTESAAMADPDRGVRVLESLRADGRGRRDRRLRNRQRIDRVPRAAAGDRAEDRPRLRDRHPRAGARPRDRALDDRPRAQPRPDRRRRGHRERGDARVPRRHRLRDGAGLLLLPAAAGGAAELPARSGVRPRRRGAALLQRRRVRDQILAPGRARGRGEQRAGSATAELETGSTTSSVPSSRTSAPPHGRRRCAATGTAQDRRLGVDLGEQGARRQRCRLDAHR